MVSEANKNYSAVWQNSLIDAMYVRSYLFLGLYNRVHLER